MSVLSSIFAWLGQSHNSGARKGAEQCSVAHSYASRSINEWIHKVQGIHRMIFIKKLQVSIYTLKLQVLRIYKESTFYCLMWEVCFQYHDKRHSYMMSCNEDRSLHNYTLSTYQEKYLHNSLSWGAKQLYTGEEASFDVLYLFDEIVGNTQIKFYSFSWYLCTWLWSYYYWWVRGSKSPAHDSNFDPDGRLLDHLFVTKVLRQLLQLLYDQDKVLKLEYPKYLPASYK